MGPVNERLGPLKESQDSGSADVAQRRVDPATREDAGHLCGRSSESIPASSIKLIGIRGATFRYQDADQRHSERAAGSKLVTSEPRRNMSTKLAQKIH